MSFDFFAKKQKLGLVLSDDTSNAAARLITYLAVGPSKGALFKNMSGNIGFLTKVFFYDIYHIKLISEVLNMKNMYTHIYTPHRL